jgi:predicted ATP-grasp superfamily ATP-dependent carboligase
MKSVRYRGIVDVGYRYDARDGLFKLLDVNPRLGCTFRLFTGESGMDVARALYLDMTGQPVPPTQTEGGRKWLTEDLDLFSAWRNFRNHELSFFQWVRSFSGVQETAFIAMDDLFPALGMIAKDFRDAWRRVFRARRTKTFGHRPRLGMHRGAQGEPVKT